MKPPFFDSGTLYKALKSPPSERFKKWKSYICRFPKGVLLAAIKMSVRRKFGRKPLRDIANHNYCRTSSKSVATAKRKEDDNRSKVEEQDDSLDRLLLVQSDLSALTDQVNHWNLPPFLCIGVLILLWLKLVFALIQSSAWKFGYVSYRCFVWVYFIFKIGENGRELEGQGTVSSRIVSSLKFMNSDFMLRLDLNKCSLDLNKCR